LLERLCVFLRGDNARFASGELEQVDTQRWASHTSSMRQNILNWNCFLECP